MNEKFIVIYSNVLGNTSVEVMADEISVAEDGMRLYDAEGRCVAFFDDAIFRAVYRKVEKQETIKEPEEHPEGEVS